MKKDPIIFYQYFATTDLDYFKELLVKRFKETGHDREIEFRTWVCDDDIPMKDGDIYCYDAFVLKFLVDNGYIQQLPEIIDTSDVFPWILETTKANQKTYGFPWMLCFDSLISRKEDAKFHNDESVLQDNVVMALGTFAPLYFYSTSSLMMESLPLENGEDITKRKAFKQLMHLAELTGDVDAAFKYHYQDQEYLSQFIEGKKRFIAQFPEIISSFPEGDYVLSHLNFLTPQSDETKLYYVDFVSVGKNVREEKLLDCLDIMEIICSGEFIYDICVPNGKPSFMCPPLNSLYPKLSKLSSVYDNLYDIVKDPNNSAVRYKTNYYDIVAQLTEEIFKAVPLYWE